MAIKIGKTIFNMGVKVEKKPLALLLVSVILLLACFAVSYAYPIPTFFAGTPFTVIIICAFLSGAIFFGYLSFIQSIFFGLELGAEKNAAIFLYIIPLLIAIYAGTKLGFALEEDFTKKRNFILDIKKIFALLLAAIILALIVELLLPTIIQLWPKDFLGMNMGQEKGIAGLINDIAKLI